MKDLRNELKLGASANDSRYVKPYERVKSTLDKLMEAFSADFRDAGIVSVVSIDIPEGETSFDYTLLLLAGNVAVSSQFRQVMEQRLSKGLVYLRSSSGCVNLDPFVVFGTCPTCHSEEAFLLDRPADGEWLSFRTNHRIREVDGEFVQAHFDNDTPLS